MGKLKIKPCELKGSLGGSLFLGFKLKGVSPKDLGDKTASLKRCECHSGCQEALRYPYQAKVLRYKRETKAKFRGCQELEEKLVNEKAIRYIPKEEIESDEFLEANGAHFHSPFDTYLLFSTLNTEGKWPMDKVLSMIAHYRTSETKDVRKQVLQMLLRRGDYDQDSHLLFTAILIDLNINERAILDSFFPGYDFSLFSRNQSIIFHDIEKNLPRKYHELKEALKTLTPKQKQAVDAYYFKNPKDLTLDQVAKKLRISKDSLIDRLEGAKKKLEKLIFT